MRCPVCKIDSMRVSASAESRIDRCFSCGAAWFDSGEIRELADGRYPGAGELAPGDCASPSGKEGKRSRMARAWKEAAGLSCPRCSRRLYPSDFQNTGVPVFRCRECGGILVPRTAVEELACTFGFHRRNAALYDALGESLALEARRRLEMLQGTGPGRGAADAKVPGLPIVVPLADDAETPAAPPVITWSLVGLAAAIYILAPTGIGGMEGVPSRIALPSGAGFGNAPGFAVWLAPFFHGGILPLAMNCLFLFVLGDNVEDRLGRVPFLIFYMACGAVAGAAHLLWGDAGAPAALGAAGAVAGVLGAYLVFFPEVPISMYGAGKVVSVPAYLFACAWAVATFFWGFGPLTDIIYPAPFSLAGSLAGFGSGAAGAILWRSLEPGTAS